MTWAGWREYFVESWANTSAHSSVSLPACSPIPFTPHTPALSTSQASLQLACQQGTGETFKSFHHPDERNKEDLDIHPAFPQCQWDRKQLESKNTIREQTSISVTHLHTLRVGNSPAKMLQDKMLRESCTHYLNLNKEWTSARKAFPPNPALVPDSSVPVHREVLRASCCPLFSSHDHSPWSALISS